jgi:PqqD family protein of HPr-rel-A system
VWRLTRPLPTRDWDGDFIVYSPLSGHTHILDVVAGEVLKLLADGGLDEAGLCARTGAFLDVPNTAAFAAEFANILARLDDLGLIEPVD